MDSSNLQETLTNISSVISEWEADIEKGKALARMKQTKDYKLVFAEGYINTEAKKLFEILTDPSGASCYSPEEIHLRLEAISHFKGYVGTKDFPGTVDEDARAAFDLIQNEQLYRKELTAKLAAKE